MEGVRSLGEVPLQITQFVRATQLMASSSRATTGRHVVKAHHYIHPSRGIAVDTGYQCSHLVGGWCPFVALFSRTQRRYYILTVLSQEGKGEIL